MLARFSVITCLLPIVAAAAPATAETLIVGLDQAELVRLDEPASTIIIGNPAIADALVQNPDLLVVTGKSYGTTNLIVLDGTGEQVEEFDLKVSAAEDDVVTVQKGRNRLSFSCTPTCNRTLVLGDQADSYQAMQQQVEGRIGLSRGQSGN